MTGRLATLLLFYKRHLRVQPWRELMAVTGVAAGVALLFAVQVAHHSVTGSFEELTRGVAGRATLELGARGASGFDQSIAEEVEHIPGVRTAAPILQVPIVAAGPKGRRAVTLVGANEQVTLLHGRISASFQRAGESTRRGLMVLSEPVARAIGVHPGAEVALLVGARREHLALDAVVPSSQLGEAAASLLAAAPLPIVQSLVDEHEKVTRVLIEPKPGDERELLRTLNARYGATLNVRSIDAEARLLGMIATPENDITLLFGAVSMLAGMILAYNALLLASEERRRFIVQLIQTGTPDGLILASLMFDALILGLTGCVIGLLAGEVISLLAYHTTPGYIAAAFAIGSGRIVATSTVLLAVGGGLLAAFAAAGLPAIAVLRSGQSAEPGAVLRALSFTRAPRRADVLVCVGGALLACVSVGASLVWPALTIAGVVAFTGGVVLCLPMIARGLLSIVRRVCSRVSDPCVHLALAELRSAPTRAVSLLATGTVAVFLLVVIGGSVTDVHTAVRLGARDLLVSGDLWIRPGGQDNVYSTQPFAYTQAQRRLEHLRVVQSVQVWRDSFVDLPGTKQNSTGRRVWVIGAPQISTPLAPSQLVQGSLRETDKRLQEGGWAAVSQTIANEHHLRIGAPFALPTPTGREQLRLAATLANYGSMQGAIVMNGAEAERMWSEPANASELAVTLRPGVPTEQGERVVQAALARTSPALNVRSTAERRSEANVVLASSLSRLSQTTIVVLIAAIASVIALMLAAVTHRRGRLDSLVAIGMSSIQFARLVFYESALVLLAGCAIGTIAGLVGQYLVDGWLKFETGSAVHYAPAWQTGLHTTGIILAIALLTSLLALARTTLSAGQTNMAFAGE